MDTKLILPVTKAQLKASTHDSSSEALSQLNSLELVVAFMAYMSIENNSGTANLPVVLEKSLMQLIPAARSSEFRAQIESQLAEKWNSELFEQASDLFQKGCVSFIDPSEMHLAEGLDRQWDNRFTSRVLDRRNPLKYSLIHKGKERHLSEANWRLFQEFRAAKDEPFDVQAFAGTGKTHLARVAIEHLNPKTTLLLANRTAQLEGMVQRLDAESCVQMSFGELAWRMYQRAFVRGKDPLHGRHNSSTNCTDKQVADTLGFFSAGNIGPTLVANIARRTVNAFATGRRKAIEVDDLPPLSTNLSIADKTYLVRCAQRIWQEMFFAEHPSLRLPVRGFHLLKFMALTNEVIPEPYTHIVIDEAHELFPSAREILDRSPQASFTLGDRYQRFSGPQSSSQTALRTRYMTMMHRAGTEIEEMLNPLLERHPDKPEALVEGTPAQKTEIRYYSKAFIPEGNVTILVGNDLVLFEWFQRLAAGGASFQLLSGSYGGFRRYISSIIELYHNGIRPEHPALFKFGTWDELQSALHRNFSFQKIESLLSKGYDHNDFQRSLMKMQEATSAKIQLGRVEDAKNLEFESVMIAPDVTAQLKYELPKDKKAELLSRVYTGITRAKSQIIAPGLLREWLE